MPREPTDDSRRWRRRPILAALIRALVVIVPIAASVVTALVLSRVLPHPVGNRDLAVWWLTILAATLLVVLLAEPLCRRALPLAALLQLSLVFPDHAPGRLRVWRRGGSVAQLRTTLQRLELQSGAEVAREGVQAALVLIAALAVHDARTRGHAERVRILTDAIAEEMRLPEDDRARLRWAALLHDIGKLSVPSEVLSKAAPPSDEEWSVLHRHPEEGSRLLGAVAQWLGPWARTVPEHHEAYDGSGYPRGLAGEDISMGGRIVALADAFEVMTAGRPYRGAVAPRAARTELVRASGRQFDPHVCRAFLNISVGRLWRSAGIFAVLGEVPYLAGVRNVSLQAGAQQVSAAVTMAAVTVAGITGVISSAGPTVAPHRGAVAAAHQASPAATPEAVPPAPAPTPAPTPAAPRRATTVPAPSTASSARSPSTPAPTQSPPPGPPGFPRISLPPRGHVHLDTAYTASGRIRGIGGTGWTLTIDYGDGSGPHTVALAGTTFTLSHRYTLKGRYRITVTVSGGGVSATATSELVVDNGTPSSG